MRNSLSLMVFLLASCTVGPDYEKPELYSDAELKSVLKIEDCAKYPRSDWYKQFGDEQLDELVETALKNNNDVKTALAKLRQARNMLKIYGVQYLPSLDGAGKYNFSKASENAGVAVDTNYFQVGLDASWEIDIWGAGRRLKEEYQALFGAAASGVDAAKLSLTAEVVNTYVSLRTAQEQLRVANENLVLQKNIYDTVEQKYNFGLADNLALSQANYLVENTSAAIPDIKYQIEAYKNALAVLTGVLPQEKMFEMNKKKNIVAKRFDFPIQNLSKFPLQSLKNRPDIMVAEYNLAAKNAAIGQAVAKLYPNISIGASAGYASKRGTRLFVGDSSAYGYAPLISLPIFHWGALVENINLQKNIKQEYINVYAQTLLNAVSEVKNAVQWVVREYEKNKHQQRAFANMKTAVSATQEKYRNGLVEFSEVLEMQQKLLTAQNELVVSNGAIYAKIAAFYKAIGVYPYNRTTLTDRIDSDLADDR